MIVAVERGVDRGPSVSAGDDHSGAGLARAGDADPRRKVVPVQAGLEAIAAQLVRG